jgi:Flp pilus assembly protein TadD
VIADPKLYLQAAADFEHGASPEDARLAFDAAVKRWPSEAVAWIGRGTAQYRAGKLAEASQDYAAALRVDGSNAGARNNLAQTLLEQGCPRHAREQLQAIDFARLQPPLREAVADTRFHVDAAVAQTSADKPACAIP